MKFIRFCTFILLSLFVLPALQADTTLTYELTTAKGEKVIQTLSITGRWLRLDTEPKGVVSYTLIDTGRLLKFDISAPNKNYQMTRMSELFWPPNSSTSPRFKPLRKKSAFGGARCQQVVEITPTGETRAEHCMTPTGQLGISDREMTTLSRFFMLGRRINTGWPGVSTPDERQVSIFSHSNDGSRQMLLSVSHGNLNLDLFDIPRNYHRLRPNLPDPAYFNAQKKAAEPAWQHKKPAHLQTPPQPRQGR